MFAAAQPAFLSNHFTESRLTDNFIYVFCAAASSNLCLTILHKTQITFRVFSKFQVLIGATPSSSKIPIKA
jgi:hypothetical protein